MHRLVCSGYAEPGQTSWDLLDLLDLDMTLDFAYGELVAGMPPEQVAEIDGRLAEAHERMSGVAEDMMVAVSTSEGNVVHITKERRDRIQRNIAVTSTKGRR